MKKALVLLLILVLGCTFASISGCDNSEEKDMTYTQITAAEAKALMDSEEDFIILDVRTDAEYAEGHIADAVLIPHEEITAKAEEVLLDKDQLILVYCRSGRCSKIAAEALVALGYTNVKEFGGIIDWPYEVVQ